MGSVMDILVKEKTMFPFERKTSFLVYSILQNRAIV